MPTQGMRLLDAVTSTSYLSSITASRVRARPSSSMISPCRVALVVAFGAQLDHRAVVAPGLDHVHEGLAARLLVALQRANLQPLKSSR